MWGGEHMPGQMAVWVVWWEMTVGCCCQRLLSEPSQAKTHSATKINKSYALFSPVSHTLHTLNSTTA